VVVETVSGSAKKNATTVVSKAEMGAVLIVNWKYAGMESQIRTKTAMARKTAAPIAT
jgi:hypothetical protein